jgi:hypothetical protein
MRGVEGRRFISNIRDHVLQTDVGDMRLSTTAAAVARGARSALDLIGVK